MSFSGTRAAVGRSGRPFIPTKNGRRNPGGRCCVKESLVGPLFWNGPGKPQPAKFSLATSQFTTFQKAVM
jgi:hypothetical protein